MTKKFATLSFDVEIEIKSTKNVIIVEKTNVIFVKKTFAIFVKSKIRTKVKNCKTKYRILVSELFVVNKT